MTTTETSNARGEVVTRAMAEAGWATGTLLGDTRVIQDLTAAYLAMRSAAPPPAAARGDVEQRARELLEAECGRPLPIDVPVCAAHSAVVASLSQQPEARGVVDEDLAVRLDDYLWQNHEICIGKAAMIRALTAALTGERNG